MSACPIAEQNAVTGGPRHDEGASAPRSGLSPSAAGAARLHIPADRQAAVAAAQRRFDVIVIGGGINGAGIARDAADRGLAVLLLEQDDWGFGSTWRSTKLIHGGLRYLEHGEAPLVFESLRDRTALLRTAPHLVRPLAFLLPVYAGGGHSLLTLRAGLTLYGLLAWGSGLSRHRVLNAASAARAVPGLATDGLRGALGYWDAQAALPERLCLENVLRATDAGAEALTQMRVERVLASGGRTRGVAAIDLASGCPHEFQAPLVVNAAGPWVDGVLRASRLADGRMGGTRGSHLVARFPGGGPRRPIYAEAPADGRPFFIVPWRGVHLIGTTDLRANGPDDNRPTEAEVAYLLDAANRLLPRDPISAADVWYAFAGVRPLPTASGTREGAITRRHHLVDHATDGYAGLTSVIGGKLSTYRTLAEQVTDRLFRELGRKPPPCRTAALPLVPGDWQPDPAAPDAAEQRRLWLIYGPRAGGIFQAARSEPSLAQPLCPHTRDTLAQVAHAVQHERAFTVADVLLRRTPAGWSPCRGLDAAPSVARCMASLMGWDAEHETEAVAAYQREVERTLYPVG